MECYCHVYGTSQYFAVLVYVTGIGIHGVQFGFIESSAVVPKCRQLQVPVSVSRHSFHVWGFFDRIRRSWASYPYHGDTYTGKMATLYLDTPWSNRWVLLAGDLWILSVDATHLFKMYACNCIRYHSGLYNRLVLCASIFHTRIPTSF